MAVELDEYQYNDISKINLQLFSNKKTTPLLSIHSSFEKEDSLEFLLPAQLTNSMNSKDNVFTDLDQIKRRFHFNYYHIMGKISI